MYQKRHKKRWKIYHEKQSGQQKVVKIMEITRSTLGRFTTVPSSFLVPDPCPSHPSWCTWWIQTYWKRGPSDGLQTWRWRGARLRLRTESSLPANKPDGKIMNWGWFLENSIVYTAARSSHERHSGDKCMVLTDIVGIPTTKINWSTWNQHIYQTKTWKTYEKHIMMVYTVPSFPRLHFTSLSFVRREMRTCPMSTRAAVP